MILRELRLRHFRGIRAARLGPLSDRLNLFFGANESGKSTMVEALHFGLFERSAGEAENKRALRSWGSNEAPEVEIALVDDHDTEWFVHKRFLDRPHTSVDVGNVHLEGEAAERRLRDLVGTRAGTRHGVPQGDLGIWPLLWVRQGEAGRRTAEAMTSEARERLLSTLAGQTGEIAIGAEGRRWLERARAAADASWTEGGRPTGALREAQEAVEAAARRVSELEERLVATAGIAQQLQQAVQEHADLDRRCVRLEAAVRRLEEEVTAAERATDALAVATREHELSRIAAQQARQAAEARLAADQARVQAQARQEAAQRRVAALHRQRAQVELELATARQWLTRATAGHADATERTTLARVAHSRAENLRRRDDLTVRIDQARAMERRLRELLDGLAHRLRADEVERLEHEMGELARARSRQANAVALHALRDLVVDGKTLSAGSQHLVELHDGVLCLDGIARLVLHTEGPPTPKVHEQQARVERLLARLGVTDLSEARERLDLQRAAEQEAAAVRSRLAVVAPQGAAPLQAEHDALDAKINLPDGPPLEEALDAERRLADELAAARADVAALEIARQSVSRDLAAAQAEVEREAGEARRLQGSLDNLPDPATLDELAQRQQSALDEAAHRLRAARDALPADDPRRRLGAEQSALQRLTRRRDEARDRGLQLRHELRQRRAEGTASQLTRAKGEHARAARAAYRLQEQAEVVRALRDALEASAVALQQRLAVPVQAMVAAQVGRMFPGSELRVDPDTGDVVGLQTRGPRGLTWERFDQLSAGAREQLAILVRLGIARVLAGDRRLPVLLDDALVNADASRRATMIEVLRETSEHLQILVFTCHDEDFDRLGADQAQRIEARPPRGR